MIDWDTLLHGPTMQAFAEPAEYMAPGQLPQAITGVFDECYAEVTPLGDLGHEIGIPAGINDRRPVIGVQLSQFLQPPEQNAFVRLPAILGKRPTDQTYLVQDIQPDGHGWALLMLNNVPTNQWPAT